MLHSFTTQGNKSLNIRLAKLAPKYKNYSRMISLDHQQQMVISHHNIQMYLYYMEVFKFLASESTEHLALFLQQCDKTKEWKKVYDNDPKIKALKKWRYKANDKGTLMKEVTQGSKEGT